MRIFIVFLCSLILAGCATRPRQYQWGGYEDMLYSGYKDPNKMVAMRLGLETQIGQLEQNRQKVPPGLYAELGTLYLQAESPDKAVTMYGRERDAWPESKGLMDALIQNLERQKKIAVGGDK